jgi:hypothetical protein
MCASRLGIALSKLIRGCDPSRSCEAAKTIQQVEGSHGDAGNDGRAIVWSW